MLHENSEKVTAVVTGEAELGKYDGTKFINLPLEIEGHPEITEWSCWFGTKSLEPLEKMFAAMGYDSKRHPLTAKEFPKEAVVEFFSRELSAGQEVQLILAPNTWNGKTEMQIKSVRKKVEVSSW
jgi:hypothetical protein